MKKPKNTSAVRLMSVLSWIDDTNSFSRVEYIRQKLEQRRDFWTG